MAGATVKTNIKGFFFLFKFVVAIVIVVGIFFGGIIMFNFGTIVKILFFTLGLFLANKMIFGGKKK